MVVLGGVDEVVEALACLRDGSYVERVEEEEDLLDDLWWYLGEGDGHGDSGSGKGQRKL